MTFVCALDQCCQLFRILVFHTTNRTYVGHSAYNLGMQNELPTPPAQLCTLYLYRTNETRRGSKIVITGIVNNEAAMTVSAVTA